MFQQMKNDVLASDFSKKFKYNRICYEFLENEKCNF